MVTTVILVTFLLTAGNFAYCQVRENLLFMKMEEVLQKQEAALNQLKEMQEKQEHFEDEVLEMQEKLEHVENNLQVLHHEMEHLKGAATDNQDSLQKIHQKTKDCLGREDLESFKNISSADIDECTQGKAECSPHAACRNSVGTYSCSCNPPFEGDGRTCEFSCESSGNIIKGLGCVKVVWEPKTWQEMNATCQEAGWRLLQDFRVRRLQEVGRGFPLYGWIGVYEGKWLEKGTPLQEELWLEGHRAETSKRCGIIDWSSTSSSLYKVAQTDCSDERLGYCQLVL